ncbi:MAG TPA: RluA family pseudouridine synthase [Kofleriaceae bacterium]|jgi:23S rRNA pseudouridine1911/1915/1917 synthase
MKITVTEADRVDKALARAYPQAGRKQLAALIEDGAVRIAGKRAKKGDRVAVGDIIDLEREPLTAEALHPVPEDVPLDILLERADLVAICKPAGVPTQPLRAGETGTIANALAARFPECATIGDDPRDGGLVHRLDIGTSGVLVAARTPESYRALRAAFGAGLVAKQYLALTDQRPVARECDAPLLQRGKRVVVDMTDGLAAHTAFTVERATDAHAVVRCIAQTGRMHQVRAHLAFVGAPIAGDTLYGGAALAGFDGFFLHAARIELPGPIVVEADVPARFAAALASVSL